VTRLLTILTLLLPLSAHAGEDITGGMWKLSADSIRSCSDTPASKRVRIVKCSDGSHAVQELKWTLCSGFCSDIGVQEWRTIHACGAPLETARMFRRFAVEELELQDEARCTPPVTVLTPPVVVE